MLASFKVSDEGGAHSTDRSEGCPRQARRDAATALLQTAELPGSHSLVYAQSGAAPVGEDE